jgi:nucleoside-diphosphate-sugar epimerase
MQVLLLGGHGKVALHLTPLLLKRAWNVTSVVRNPDHESEILALGKGLKGNLNVLISSLEHVKSAGDAQKIIDTVSPDYVVWSAGMDFPSPYQKYPTTHKTQHSQLQLQKRNNLQFSKFPKHTRNNLK